MYVESITLRVWSGGNWWGTTMEIILCFTGSQVGEVQVEVQVRDIGVIENVVREEQGGEEGGEGKRGDSLNFIWRSKRG
jgi:hypothetical protein